VSLLNGKKNRNHVTVYVTNIYTENIPSLDLFVAEQVLNGGEESYRFMYYVFYPNVPEI
jgi:hypothetical protein